MNTSFERPLVAVIEFEWCQERPNGMMYEVVFNLFVIVNVIGSRLGSMGSDAVNDGNCRQSCHFQKRDVGGERNFLREI